MKQRHPIYSTAASLMRLLIEKTDKTFKNPIDLRIQVISLASGQQPNRVSPGRSPLIGRLSHGLSAGKMVDFLSFQRRTDRYSLVPYFLRNTIFALCFASNWSGNAPGHRRNNRNEKLPPLGHITMKLDHALLHRLANRLPAWPGPVLDT